MIKIYNNNDNIMFNESNYSWKIIIHVISNRIIISLYGLFNVYNVWVLTIRID